MAELTGLDLATHLDCIFSELKSQATIYGYPEKKIFRGYPDYDFSVDFHDRRAFTPLGPASGPHTQLAQNIILSFLGGGRIMELKTVQILDRLEIPRPCIDVRNIGFNVEWSQELRLEESLHEYLVAWILLKIIEESEILGIPKGDPFYQTIFDISVGYDLKGISTPEIGGWLQRIINTREDIDRLLATLPPRYQRYKNLDIPANISDSATLSTFHGCPRDEIEAIVKHLISEHHLHVMVKMNPTLAGYDFVKKTLQEDLGYAHIELDKKAFDDDMQFDEAVAMMHRLIDFGKQHGRRVGAKFTNTLVVKNGEDIFSDEVMYLSGAPLHVISMNAMHRFRSAVGEDLPISFSAGIAKQNVVDAVLCNMVPITSCTDLLKTGGYTRMADYLRYIKAAMEKSATANIAEFICREDQATGITAAGAANAAVIVPKLVEQPFYHHQKNQKIPRKIDSHLTLFDCITCNKCLPVCPNAANFSIPVGKQSLATKQYRYADGDFLPEAGPEFILEQEHQIANLADFCNECGDCDTYCPEYGGPFIEKPRFFHNEKTWLEYASYDGFYFPDKQTLRGRLGGKEYLLSYNSQTKVYLWQNGQVEFLMDEDHQKISGFERAPLADGDVIDLQPYHTMRAIFEGMKKGAADFPGQILIP